MQRFVVGSGRCGSTLLTFMLDKHPDVAVFSEFFASLDRLVWRRNEVMTGDEFRRFLDGPNVHLDIMLRRGLIPSEVLADTNGVKTLPALFLGCMQLLSDAPEALYQELLAKAETFPPRRVAEQVTALLDWLTVRIGSTHWVERSGPSNYDLPELVAMYPDALYVHLHRDSHEAALSMQKHIYFRLEASLLFDPPSRADIEEAERLHKCGEVDTFAKRMVTELPLEKYGEYLTYMQIQGTRGLRQLAPSQVLDVKFEDVVMKPQQTLRTIADFLRLPDRPGWMDEAAKLVTDGGPPTRFDKLDAEEQSRLRASCRVVEMLLGREPVPSTCATLQLMKDTM